MDDDHQQRVHFLVALLQCPAGALAQLVADSTSAVSTTLFRLVAATAHALPDQDTNARNDSIRPLLHAVIARLASHPKSNLPLALVALYSYAFLESNHHLVAENVIPEAFASSPKLAQELRATCGPALTDALDLDSDSAEADPLQAHIVLSLIRATAPSGPPSLLGPIVPRLVQTLNEAYPRLLGVDHRRLRLAVLETTHDLVQVAIRAVPAVVEALEPVLAQLLLTTITPGIDSGSGATSTTTALLARDLVSLYEPLGAQLAEAVQGAVGPVARNVKDQIARLRRLSASLPIDDDWLADLRRAEAVGGAADPDVGIAKERQEPVTMMTANEDQMTGRDAEGRNVNEADPAQVLSKADNEADLAQAVASLLDLFPSESPRFLRACLVDPTFTSDSGTSSLSVDAQLQRTTERVVEALLGEAQLPDRLLRIRFGQDDKDENEEDGDDGVAVNKVESLPFKPTKTSTTGAIERRNVYDDDKYFQRGTLLGPAASRARSTQSSSRIQLDERLKASIIALAERESSDEDDDDNYDDDDFPGDEEGGAGTATPRIKIGAADEEPDENEQEGEERGGARGQRQQQQQQPRTPSAPSPYDPSTVLLLEQAYLRSPAVFARDSATRRGKARKDLRDRTKLGDEQIEGWKIMLEREPKKLQKLQDKHTDLAARANRPQHVADGADSADSTALSRNASPARASSHQQPPHLGRSRGGASSGRGGGGRGGSANGHGHGHGPGQGQQQQQKRSDGGRREHDRAKRGRDRKLARMGAGPPPA